MIKINKKPYLCSFSKNSIDFQVETNMLYSTATVSPELKILVDSTPTSGHTFTFSWTNPETFDNESISIVAMDYPELSPFGISSFSAPVPGITQIEIYNVLLRSKLFNAWFTIELVGIDTLIIKAKIPSKHLVIVYTSSTTGFFTITNLNDYHEAPLRNGYEMSAMVYFEKEYLSNNFEIVATIDCTVDPLQISEIDVSEIIDAEIEDSWSEYPAPWKQSGVYKSTNIRRYYLKFTEKWDDKTDDSSIVTDYLFAHWGGISFEDQLIDDAVNINDGTKFLTWNPSGKKNAADQQDWLAWMNLSFDESYSVKMSVVTNVGTTSVVIQSLTLAKFETVVFNTGHDFNDVSSFVPSGEVLNYWSFQIFWKEVAVSESFRYYLTNDCLYKTIGYFNSFGIFETFKTSGVWSETMNVSSTIASRSESFNLNRLMPKSFVFNSNHTNSYKAISSILTNLEAERLQPMLNSMISFVLEKNRWIPTIITTSKSSLYVLNEYLSQLEIEILKANENDRASFYELTPMIDFVEDYGIEAVTLNSNGITLTAWPDLKVYKESTQVNTLVWSVGLQKYLPTTPMITEGFYRVQGTVSGPSGTYTIRKHFRYELTRLRLKTFNNSSIGIGMNAATSQTVDVDWGDGTFQTVTYYNGGGTALTHTYTKNERKHIVLSKPNFKDVILWRCFYDVGMVDFSIFENLKTVDHRNGLNGNVYLHDNKLLETIIFQYSLITSINIGFQKNLTLLSLTGLAIGSDALDDLFIELWTFRKLYSNIAKSITIDNVGSTPSPTVLAIANGTGLYAGEGLISNYSWTITFI